MQNKIPFQKGQISSKLANMKTLWNLYKGFTIYPLFLAVQDVSKLKYPLSIVKGRVIANQWGLNSSRMKPSIVNSLQNCFLIFTYRQPQLAF